MNTLNQDRRHEKRIRGNTGSTAAEGGGEALTGHPGGDARIASGIISSRQDGLEIKNLGPSTAKVIIDVRIRDFPRGGLLITV